ncbi:MAG: FAD-binding oxidoreductase [Pseudonocardia sp.]|nr:FAD-binding oxidoreductase [Pseudonocardia sp.]
MDVCDVVVVGGGIAGASVAYELAATRSVILLEAEPELGRHSTARSAATWIPGHGNDVVRTLIAASGPRFARLSDELDAPPLLRPMDVLWVAFDEPSEIALSGMLAERKGEPDAPVALTAAEAEECAPTLRPGRLRAAARTDAAAVDTDALHQAYVRGLKARGGSVRTATPARSISREGTGWRVGGGDGGDGEVAAALVVDAAGAWADVVAERAGVPRIGLQPYRRTIAIARVPDRARLRGAMVCEAIERFYYKIEGDDLLLSAADETPSEPRDARPDELDVALALERVEEATGLGLRSIRTSWAGLRSFVPDRRPVVGAWPDHPGFAFVAGQGGSGIETAPALSAFAAAVLTGAPPPADVTVDPAVLAPTRG